MDKLRMHALTVASVLVDRICDAVRSLSIEADGLTPQVDSLLNAVHRMTPPGMPEEVIRNIALNAADRIYCAVELVVSTEDTPDGLDYLEFLPPGDPESQVVLKRSFVRAALSADFIFLTTTGERKLANVFGADLFVLADRFEDDRMPWH